LFPITQVSFAIANQESDMSYSLDYPIVERAPASARVAFIQRTYGHLAGAILAFIALETAFLKIPGVAEAILRPMLSGGWILVLLAFMGAAYVAQWWANSQTSRAMQYLGLGLYVLVEAIIFLPILYIAANYVKNPNIIPIAGIMTLGIFGGLTISVFITGRDFSFLGPILSIGIGLALAFVIAAWIFGFGVPLWYSFIMVALASGFILYDTSNVIHHYRTDQHVAAALALFASVALLFFYILRILIANSRNN
jgi:FtsH-binding integral membrane protein